MILTYYFLMTYLSLETEAPLARCPDIFKDHMRLSEILILEGVSFVTKYN